MTIETSAFTAIRTSFGYSLRRSAGVDFFGKSEAVEIVVETFRFWMVGKITGASANNIRCQARFQRYPLQNKRYHRHPAVVFHARDPADFAAYAPSRRYTDQRMPNSQR